MTGGERADGLSTRDQADGIVALVAAGAVRGSLALLVLRWALRWALARVSAEARERSRDGAWARRASDARLAATSLRPLAWTSVLEAPAPGSGGPVERAAALVAAALAFRAELAAADCPPRLAAHAGRLFGTTLVPGARAFTAHRGAGRHVLVGAGGVLRAVEVLDAAGGAREVTDILEDLRACVEAAPLDAGASPLALTVRPRAEAAVAWAAVERADPEAASRLRDALFYLVFDPASPGDDDACGRLAQGGGEGSRCFWHALQIVVFADARAALVGSFVAGVEGEGAAELGQRLGRAAPAIGASRGPKSASRAAPPALVWSAKKGKGVPDGAATRAPPSAGGLLRAKGCGEKAWREAGVKPGAAVVVALRLALDAIAPDLDDLECMVNVGHLEAGVVTRLGTNTEAMGSLVRAARDPGRALGDLLPAALAAHRARVREAKNLGNAEVALQGALFALPLLPRPARGALRAVVRWVALRMAWRAPADARRDLPRPLVAIDSSVRLPPGVVAFGRFGVLAPARSLWIHHALDEDDLTLVLQLGPDHIDAAETLRQAIVGALARVLAAAREGGGAPSDPSGLGVAPTRLAYRRLLTLLAALGPAPAGGDVA